ncbi:cytochrome D1 domain-containing protein [Amycolatopsis rubida]|uniref:WD40 repeat n=1 Tax=Amycolatopsis rubida TaxID=112413 RepID=A0A1I6AII2_9PSEU|nr:cytochrome D1 domain-containing protein [Amycolatopsis rubida]SFQ68317.1 WD40 repeat [Amycolatopsis rubida]
MPRAEQPLPADGTVLTGFARALRDVRTAAGTPTYRALAKRAHYSSSTLAEAVGGKKLPSLAVTVAFAEACGADKAEWERRWHETASRLAAECQSPPISRERSDDDSAAPYLGLRAYRPGDAARFHGRDELSAQLRAAVADRRFVTVVGASGAGKSSLLQAGLIARADGAREPVIAVTPGRSPVEEIAVALAAVSGGSATALRRDIVGDPAGLHHAVRQLLAAREADGDLLVAVDQFEELFTVCQNSTERTAFVAALITAATAETSRARVVVGLRADFYAHCCAHPELAQAMNGAQVVVGPMTSEQLRAAIAGPAAAAGLSVESALLAEVTADALGEPGALPLVSHAMLQTWWRRRGTVLSLSGYQAAGGIAHALAQTAETVFTDLGPAQQRAARELFIRLTALGEGTEDTKRRLRRSELDLPDRDLETVLDKLSAARLIVLGHDTVEIAHEALIRGWPRLRGWLDENRDGLRLHRRLSGDASDWTGLDRDPGTLYRGLRLTAASDWAGGGDVRLTALEREFLDASRAAEKREQARHRRRTRQLRWLAASLAVLLVAALAVAVVAVRQREHALAQERTATSRQLAAEAQTQAGLDPAAAIRKSLDAYHAEPTAEARSAILSLASHRAYHALLPSSSKARVGVALSPDGRWLAAPGGDLRLTLWDVPGRRRVAVFGAPFDRVSAVMFSPDSQRLAAGTVDGHIHIWHLASRTIAASLTVTEPDTAVAVLRFSPDGRLLASADRRNQVKLWDTGGRGTPVTLAAQHDGPDLAGNPAVAFSPDGALLAFTDATGALALWDLHTATRAEPLPAPSAWTSSADFTSDGHTLVTVNRASAAIRLWDVTTRRQVAELAGDSVPQNSVVVDRANAQLITVNVRGTVDVWDLGRRTLLATLAKNVSLTGSAAVSSDGKTIAGIVGNGIALWDRTHLPLLGVPPVTTSLQVSESGRTVLAGGSGSPTVIWDTGTRQGRVIATVPRRDIVSGLAVLSPDEKVVAFNDNGRITVLDARTGSALVEVPRTSDLMYAKSFDFSRDSRTLAVAMLNGGVWLYDLGARRYVRNVAEGIDAANTRYSPDGRMFAFTSEGTTINILSTDGYSLIKKLKVVDNPGEAWPGYRFSRDGSLLVSNDNMLTVSGKLLIWDTATFAKRAEFFTPGTAASVPYFSPDRRYIATFGNNDAVTLWDAATGTRWATLTGHAGKITGIYWNGTGVLASSSEDNTVILWNTDVDDAIRQLCDHIERDFPGTGTTPAICSAHRERGRN